MILKKKLSLLDNRFQPQLNFGYCLDDAQRLKHLLKYTNLVECAVLVINSNSDVTKEELKEVVATGLPLVLPNQF